jgi:hypothetical protein
MSDSLDPTDAIVGGITDAVKRLLAFLLVTGGAALLGSNLHEAPNHFASIRLNGLSAAFDSFKQIDALSPALWIVMMLHSTFIWYLIPFLLLYVWLLARLWQGADMFSILLVLALAHPLHTFIYMQRQDPLPPGDLILTSALLIVSEVGLAGLILWWRHVRENAPLQSEETEPEL